MKGLDQTIQRARRAIRHLMGALCVAVCVAGALAATPAHAQYAATNCSNIIQASSNGANNQKQSVDAVNNMLTQMQNTAKTCLTNMMKMFGGGFGGLNFANILNSLMQAACQIVTTDVSEVANQAYTMPGGMGTIKMNGSVNVAIPAVSMPMGGAINLVQPAAPAAGSGGLWSSLSNMLKW